MNDHMEWRRCSHCKHEKFCMPSVMRDHEEDCLQRPSRVAKMKICPRCASQLQKLSPRAAGFGDSWICPNSNCDYAVGVITGGKVS
jgi:hypothetical protein